MENINNVRNSINTYMEKFSRKQIITVAVSTLVILGAMVALIMYMTRTKYVTLYSNLDLKTMSAVTQSLDGMAVDYKIENQNSILVPEQSKNKIMIDLAGQNIPNAKFDFSNLIKMNSMFMSDDEKNTAKQYALMNQISSVIESIPAVEKAQVNLVIPKNSEFVLNENKQVAKASVKLSLKAGSQLDQESISGIAAIVANSVEGLSPENVTIHGQNGQILNHESLKDGSVQAKNNFEMQEQVKRDIENSLYNFLGPMYGADNFSVMVSVKLNFDNEVTQTKTFTSPIEGETSGLVRSEQQLKEEVKNKSDAIGTPGVTSNNNEAGGTTNYVTVDENGNSTYNRSESTINYELNEIVKNVEKAKGTVDSITVSVILNSDTLEGGELTDENKTKIVNLITTATGLDTKAVEVFAQSFNKSSDSTGANSSGSIPLWQWIAIAVIALIPIILLVLLLRRNKKSKQNEGKVMDPKTGELVDRDSMKIKKEEIEALEINMKESGKKKSIEDLIDRNPEIVANLLKTWIDEE